MFGAGNQMVLVVTQAFVFAGLCLIVHAIAPNRRPIATRSPRPGWRAVLAVPVARGAGAHRAVDGIRRVAGDARLHRAVQTSRLSIYVLAGVLFSLTTLVRPAFVLLPFFLAVAVPVLVRSERERRALTGWAALCLAAAFTLLPWFTYNYVHLGRFTLSPAGGVGRGLWEASWPVARPRSGRADRSRRCHP